MFSLERITYLSQHHPDKGLFLADHTHPGAQSPWQPNQGPDCHHVEQSREKAWVLIWNTVLTSPSFYSNLKIYCDIKHTEQLTYWEWSKYLRSRQPVVISAISVSKEWCLLMQNNSKLRSEWKIRKWRERIQLSFNKFTREGEIYGN